METSGHGGNIIQGFENYLKNQNQIKRRNEVGDSDRMFSNSSLTSAKSLEIVGDGDESETDFSKFPGGGGSVSGSAGGVVTVHVPPAPRSQEATSAQLKRERDREWQRKKRARRATSNASADETEIIPKRTTKRQRMQDDE